MRGYSERKQEIGKIKATATDVDTSLVNSSDENTMVATLDKELKKRLKGKKSIAKIFTFAAQLIIAGFLVVVIIYSIF